MPKIIKPYYDVKNKIYRVGLFSNEYAQFPISVSSIYTFKTLKEITDYINIVNIKINKDPQKRKEYRVIKENDTKSSAITNLDMFLDIATSEELNYVLEKSSIKGVERIDSKSGVEVAINRDKESKMLIIADSVGDEGDIAVDFVIKELKTFFENYLFVTDFHGTQNDINKFSTKIKEISNRLSNCFGGTLKTPPTTMTMALLLKKNIIFFSIGDSKCYSINNDNRISLIAQDHSYIWDKTTKSSKLDDNYNGKIKSTAMGGIKEPQIDTVTLDKDKISSLILCNEEMKRELSQLEVKDLVVNNNDDITKKIIIYFQRKKGKDLSTIAKYIHLCNKGKTNAELQDASVAVWKKK